MSLHPLLRKAGDGELPPWARARDDRVSHMERVAGLLDGWARALGSDRDEALRWRAVGMLHDVLRDEEPERLRPLVPEGLRDLPGPLLHGPAAAARLRREGVSDVEVLRAVSFHTTGHPELGVVGRMLYVADFLEPGRGFLGERRRALRERMPGEWRTVLREVVRERIGETLAEGRPLRPETVAFWNSLSADADG
jgi:HD superfamily phosphohydrolase YqeK